MRQLISRNGNEERSGAASRQKDIYWIKPVSVDICSDVRASTLEGPSNTIRFILLNDRGALKLTLCNITIQAYCHRIA